MSSSPPSSTIVIAIEKEAIGAEPELPAPHSESESKIAATDAEDASIRRTTHSGHASAGKSIKTRDPGQETKKRSTLDETTDDILSRYLASRSVAQKLPAGAESKSRSVAEPGHSRVPSSSGGEKELAHRKDDGSAAGNGERKQKTIAPNTSKSTPDPRSKSGSKPPTTSTRSEGGSQTQQNTRSSSSSSSSSTPSLHSRSGSVSKVNSDASQQQQQQQQQSKQQAGERPRNVSSAKKTVSSSSKNGSDARNGKVANAPISESRVSENKAAWAVLETDAPSLAEFMRNVSKNGALSSSSASSSGRVDGGGGDKASKKTGHINEVASGAKERKKISMAEMVRRARETEKRLEWMEEDEFGSSFSSREGEVEPRAPKVNTSKTMADVVSSAIEGALKDDDNKTSNKRARKPSERLNYDMNMAGIRKKASSMKKPAPRKSSKNAIRSTLDGGDYDIPEEDDHDDGDVNDENAGGNNDHGEEQEEGETEVLYAKKKMNESAARRKKASTGPIDEYFHTLDQANGRSKNGGGKGKNETEWMEAKKTTTTKKNDRRRKEEEEEEERPKKQKHVERNERENEEEEDNDATGFYSQEEEGGMSSPQKDIHSMDDSGGGVEKDEESGEYGLRRGGGGGEGEEDDDIENGQSDEEQEEYRKMQEEETRKRFDASLSKSKKRNAGQMEALSITGIKGKPISAAKLNKIVTRAPPKKKAKRALRGSCFADDVSGSDDEELESSEEELFSYEDDDEEDLEFKQDCEVCRREFITLGTYEQSECIYNCSKCSNAACPTCMWVGTHKTDEENEPNIYACNNCVAVVIMKRKATHSFQLLSKSLPRENAEMDDRSSETVPSSRKSSLKNASNTFIDLSIVA